MIHLIGPGDAGKSTTGRELAARLGMSFIDLDAEFARLVGDISHYMDTSGYRVYASKNIELYFAVKPDSRSVVFALSSGFMVYPARIYPAYAALRADI